MLRVRFTSVGWSGGPGLGTFYFDPIGQDVTTASLCVDRVQTYLGYLQSLTPPAVTYTVSGLVDRMDPANGEISETYDGGARTSVVGTANPTAFAPLAVAGNGSLLTSTFVRGHRVRGRSYVSPLASGCMDSAGQFTAAKKAVLVTGLTHLWEDMSKDPPLVVWHRPSDAGPGSAAPVTGVAVPDKLAVLRSRRD